MLPNFSPFFWVLEYGMIFNILTLLNFSDFHNDLILTREKIHVIGNIGTK